MSEVIYNTGIKREPGWLYYLDSNGDVKRVTMKRAGKPFDKKIELVTECGIVRRANYLYFINKEGNVCEAKLQRGGRKDGAKCKRKRKEVGEMDPNYRTYNIDEENKKTKKQKDAEIDEQSDEDEMPRINIQEEDDDKLTAKERLEKEFEEMEDEVDEEKEVG